MNKKYWKQVRKMKYFTKKAEKTWYVQSRKDSYLESFYVTLIPGGVVMSGDYDGVIVMPYTQSDEETINWLTNATTTSYFAEKVRLGNQHHETNEYNRDQAEEEILRQVAYKFDMDNMEEHLKKWMYYKKPTDTKLLNLVNKHMKENEDDEDFMTRDSEEFKKLYEILCDIRWHSFENECDFWDLCKELESQHEFHDMWELDPRVITDQLQWQQCCLMWWAKNIRNNMGKKEFVVKGSG